MWTPTADQVTTTGVIRITSNLDPSISTASTAPFQLVTGSLTPTGPTAGVNARVGSVLPITWNAAGFALTSPTLKIELSRDGGATWEVSSRRPTSYRRAGTGRSRGR